MNPFRGSLVALPTFFRDGELDLETLGRAIDWHAVQGSDGVVVLGTTGEAATLSDAERAEVLEHALGRAAGRMPVIAGTGTNCTRKTIEHTRAAEAAGADGALVVTPYYNRPTQAGLVAHYRAVAEATSLPIALYNVPSRTGCDLLPETASAIAAACPNAVAIKEASGTVERGARLLADGALAVLAGEDLLMAELARRGAAGAVNVVGNVAPARVAELLRAASGRRDGDPERARELEESLAPLVHALFVETNPVPVKAALSMLGFGSEEVRLPLVPVSPAGRNRVRAALESAEGLGLLAMARP
jgi:4-hydroxy-tetrahydrodipicolinate synthase